MRFVLDTNVVVSALVWGGQPHRLIEAAAFGDIEIVTSPVLLDELRGVLARGHLASRLQSVHGTVERAVALYAELAIMVSPIETPRVVAADAADDHVVAAAVAAAAAAIVSGDKHLLLLGRHGAVEILKPADALLRIDALRA